MGDLISELLAVVARHAPADGVAWLEQQLVFDPARFHAAFAAAGRRLGRAEIGAADAECLARAGLPWSATAGADECGRAALVMSGVAAVAPSDQVALVRDLVRRGEVRERQAVLRVLAGLPEPARFAELAIDACRTNVQSVFEAIACDNAYPCAYFPDPALHQMVLKAIFLGVPVRRITGLEHRISAELVRMVEAFASERRAAHRPVSDDVEWIRARKVRS